MRVISVMTGNPPLVSFSKNFSSVPQSGGAVAHFSRGGQKNLIFSFKMASVRLKFSRGGVMTPSKPISPYEQLLPLPTPCFKMFLERPPLQAPVTATSSPFTTLAPSPIKILIIHLMSQSIPSVTTPAPSRQHRGILSKMMPGGRDLRT